MTAKKKTGGRPRKPSADKTIAAQALELKALRRETKAARTTLAARDRVIKIRDTALAALRVDHSALIAERNSARAERDAARAELGQAKDDHISACQLVAEMHAAAVGEVTGPRRGVVEDVADVRAELVSTKGILEEARRQLLEVTGERDRLRREIEHPHLERVRAALQQKAEAEQKAQWGKPADRRDTPAELERRRAALEAKRDEILAERRAQDAAAVDPSTDPTWRRWAKEAEILEPDRGEPRAPDCKCHQEEGDSPCLVHPCGEEGCCEPGLVTIVGQSNGVMGDDIADTFGAAGGEQGGG